MGNCGLKFFPSHDHDAAHLHHLLVQCCHYLLSDFRENREGDEVQMKRFLENVLLRSSYRWYIRVELFMYFFISINLVYCMYFLC